MKAKHVDLGPLPNNLNIRPELGRQDMTSEMKTLTWHTMEGNAVIQEQGSRLEGLSASDVKERMERFGPNKIREEKQISAWEILLRQLLSFFNYVLYAAAIVAFIAKDFADASFICAILIINTVLSFIQEYKATRAIQSLKNLIEEKIKVIRDGSLLEVDVTEIVPGDIIPLEEGMKVPADGRLVEEHALFIDEAMLTGESVPAEKEVTILSQEVPLAERTNMVFAGTTVVKGTGKAVITETGMNTELGKIAQALQESEIPPTSFELEVDKLSKNITFVISGLVVLVAFLLFLQHQMKVAEIIIFCLSLGVSAIPESLPVVLSFTLAVGAQQMAVRKALARRLAIVESLGSVDVICTDKTGTLTKNEMTVQALYTPGHHPYFVTGIGYDPIDGEVQFREMGRERLDYLMKTLVLCNDARKVGKGETGYLGDPTEIALLVVAEKGGLNPEELQSKFPRIDEIPFSSDRKLMTTLHNIQDKRVAIVKGAPEVFIDKCSRCYIHGEFRDLTEEIRQEIRTNLEQMEEQALRVLAAAERVVEEGMSHDAIEQDLTFLGLVGMIDPPRAEVRDAINTARGAGIKPVMITGDNAVTAGAIARQLGIGQNTVTGDEVDAIAEKELAQRVEDIDIIARASPINKLRILKAIQENNHFAIMTGDGVNDAPALKQADVGVAMGLRGTDAAKESSGLVLLNDNYATIIAAIEEGRRIFDNIRKFVNYLLTCNVGEVLTVLCGVLWGLQPLTAIMVLWVNILTDVGPAIALGVDPANPGMMKRQPRKHDDPILNRGLIWTTVFIGLKKGIENFAVFLVGYYFLANSLPGPERLQYAQTMAFTGIVVYAFARIYIIRAFDTIRFFQNPWLIYSLVFAAVVQLFIIYCPQVNDFFGLHILDWKAWTVLGILGLWASTTGVWTSRWVESWAGHVINTSGVEKSRMRKVRKSLQSLGDKGSKAIA